MAKVKLTQVKSIIDRSKRQKATMEALGLRKINHSIEKELSPQVEGMIKKSGAFVKSRIPITMNLSNLKPPKGRLRKRRE